MSYYLYNAVEKLAQTQPNRLHNKKFVRTYLMRCATNYAKKHPHDDWDGTLHLIEVIIEEFCTCV
jgi:hypothetical protein